MHQAAIRVRTSEDRLPVPIRVNSGDSDNTMNKNEDVSMFLREFEGRFCEARSLLAEQIGKFTLECVSENGEISFKANGQIDFFGEEALTRWCGAEGQNCM
jgi:hypothetical protein